MLQFLRVIFYVAAGACVLGAMFPGMQGVGGPRWTLIAWCLGGAASSAFLGALAGAVDDIRARLTEARP